MMHSDARQLVRSQCACKSVLNALLAQEVLPLCRVRASFCVANGHADGILRAQPHHTASSEVSEGAGNLCGKQPSQTVVGLCARGYLRECAAWRMGDLQWYSAQWGYSRAMHFDPSAASCIAASSGDGMARDRKVPASCMRGLHEQDRRHSHNPPAPCSASTALWCGICGGGLEEGRQVPASCMACWRGATAR